MIGCGRLGTCLGTASFADTTHGTINLSLSAWLASTANNKKVRLGEASPKEMSKMRVDPTISMKTKDGRQNVYLIFAVSDDFLAVSTHFLPLFRRPPRLDKHNHLGSHGEKQVSGNRSEARGPRSEGKPRVDPATTDSDSWLLSSDSCYLKIEGASGDMYENKGREKSGARCQVSGKKSEVRRCGGSERKSARRDHSDS
jgi:hypothetical protein